MQAKVYLDEDVSPLVARLLRERGFDVISALEMGHRGLSGEDHLLYAPSEGRVLVSYNIRDYSRLAEVWFAAGREHAGLILGYGQYSRSQTGEVVRTLVRLLNTVTAEEIRNASRHIEEFRS